MKKYDYILSFVVAVAAVGLSYMTKNILSLDKLLSNNYVGVEFSDFYSQAGKGAFTLTSEDVAVVAVDGCSRRQLASLIDTLSGCCDVICLDLSFEEQQCDDSILISKIKDCKCKMVLPYVLEENHGRYQKRDSSYFYDRLTSPPICYGAVNLNIPKGGGVVRRFKPEFDLTGGGAMDNFAVVAVKCCTKTQKDNAIKSLSKDLRMINYHYVAIPKYSIADAYQDMSKLRGRIVLLGKDHNYSDRHGVPVYGDLSGVLIHAYTIETILSGQYVRENIGWIDYPLALIVTFLFCLFVCFVRRKYSYAEGLFVRMVQIGLLFVFLIVGLLMFIRHDVYVSFSLSLLTMSMSIMLMDIVTGLYGLIKKYLKK